MIQSMTILYYYFLLSVHISSAACQEVQFPAPESDSAASSCCACVCMERESETDRRGERLFFPFTVLIVVFPGAATLRQALSPTH